MSEIVESLKEFVQYASLLKGDERGEAQVFCDRLFRAFGHAGYKEAGAVLEDRLKDDEGRTSFVDLLWRPRLLFEMKRRGEKLHKHYQQAFDYWILAVPNRPQFVVLCNFDEFWIYDLDRQIYEPVDTVSLQDLPKRYTALNFLFPANPKPIFGNDLEAVTRDAADKVARVFGSLVRRDEDRPVAQRFVLQTVVAMFAEDIDLLPKGLVLQLIDECREGASSYDLFGALFRQMNTEEPARAGRFKGVPYFNGGLFAKIKPLELNKIEAILLLDAARKDWSKVNPAVFGTLFQSSMFAPERHATGAHYTAEADILRVVNPSIVRPWRERVDAASTPLQLLQLRDELHAFRVLDPACGSGNFLYVAYRELARVEIVILEVLREKLSAKDFQRTVKGIRLIDPHNLFGIDINPFGIELAKVTLMLAKKLALEEALETLGRDHIDLLPTDDALPLDNLDASFTCGDALFVPWPTAHAIIGNPPYQSKNKMQTELGRAYVNKVRARYPEVPGRADYAVYWFRRAHDELLPGSRAGLVGTNTIRQNYSREGGLDYIVQSGGTITEAVSSQAWSGEAAVHVSIVNWIKGDLRGPKALSRQLGDGSWEVVQVERINSSLSFDVDVSSARVLEVNAKEGGVYQGQTHGHKAFLLTMDEARYELRARPASADVLFPYLTAVNLFAKKDSLPSRYVIDFGDRSLLESQHYPKLFERIETKVLPARKRKALAEQRRNAEVLGNDPAARVNHHHSMVLERWWQLFWPRHELIAAIRSLPRYIVCGQVTKRPIFEFISPAINPNAALIVFPYADDYSFGILQSGIHWVWFINRCSTLKGDFRYTSNTVFDTFPWPQNPSADQVRDIAQTSKALRALRRELMAKHGLSLRVLYRSLDQPGKHPLKDAQSELDATVRAAYGMPRSGDPLPFLLDLNRELAAQEEAGSAIVGPGLPPAARRPEAYISDDCVTMPLPSRR